MHESKSRMMFILNSVISCIDYQNYNKCTFQEIFAVEKNIRQPFSFEKNLKRRCAAFKTMLIIKN